MKRCSEVESHRHRSTTSVQRRVWPLLWVSSIISWWKLERGVEQLHEPPSVRVMGFVHVKVHVTNNEHVPSRNATVRQKSAEEPQVVSLFFVDRGGGRHKQL